MNSAFAALALMQAAPVAAQSASAPGYAFEITSTDRWLHARQSPAFTPWSDADIPRWLRVDSVLPGPSSGTRALRIRRNFPSDRTHLRLVHDTLGTVRSLVSTYPERAVLPGQEFFDAMMARGSARAALLDRPAGFGTFEVDARELLPAFHPPRLEPGAQWTDSVRLENSYGESQFSVRGLRHSRIVRDTLVEGSRHWIVHDSATVVLAESWQRLKRTLDTLVVMQRQAAGTIVGRYLYDPTIALFRERADTVRLAGEVSIHYPDGRVIGVRARYERVQRWLRYEAAAAVARREETLEAMNSRRGGMLRLPRDPLETRLRAGDPVLVDSLIGEWHRSRDPDERQRLRSLIALGSSPGDAVAERLRQLALEAGDTVFVLQHLRSTASLNRPLQLDDLELLLPLLRDPSLALAFGLEADAFFGAIAEGLVRYPPAILPDRSGWPCTPEACELLAAQFDRAGDPRLRDLGLVARFVVDPAEWEDEIRQRAAEGSALVRPAVQLLMGVGATWPLAAQLPLPAADAPWRGWLDWMGAISPDLPPPPPTALPMNPLRFERSHYNAIRFFEERSGRPVTEEIRQRLAGAESDSARLVFGTILHGLGERETDPFELASALAAGSEADRALALRELPGLLRTAPPAADSLAAAMVDRLLAIAIDGAAPWPELYPSPESAARRSARRISTAEPVLILAESVPAAIRGRWAERAELLTEAEWRARSPRLPAVLVVPGEVLRNGPFLRVSIRYEARVARREDQAPSGSAGGFTVYLMESADGWVAVSEEMWIT